MKIKARVEVLVEAGKDKETFHQIQVKEAEVILMREDHIMDGNLQRKSMIALTSQDLT